MIKRKRLSIEHWDRIQAAGSALALPFVVYFEENCKTSRDRIAYMALYLISNNMGAVIGKNQNSAWVEFIPTTSFHLYGTPDEENES
jgi:hypothetical protein